MVRDSRPQSGSGAPLVSVLIPVFNQEAYIADAIRSAQDQTYRHVEILVHDDGSTDRTGAIVEELAAADPRIRFTRTAHNQGVAVARNLLIAAARGTYICWLDADDMMAADKVMTQCAFLDANPPFAAVATALRPIDAAGRPLRKGGHRRPGDASARIFVPAFATVTLLYRREALLRAYPLRPLRDGSDFDLVLRVAEGGEIAEIREALYIRRYHAGQMSRAAASGHIIAVASNIYRTFGLADIIDDATINEAALLRRILSDRPLLFAAMRNGASDPRLTMNEGWFALVLVLLHTVRRIGTLGERLGVITECLRHSPGAFFQVVGFWLRRRLAPPS
ncbi:MAG: glycosyltransferase family 2 protein [Alphaproteobacteria bacterium]|nr:glycosyltransferase family 2 protein [Alphaproteobacteria bacterium]